MKRPHDVVDSPAKLLEYCASIADAPSIGFDTEFISEYTYKPRLCLLQVAAAGRLALIDPLAIPDLGPFWELLVTPGRRTIVHAGREELQFCRRATGKRPSGLVDLQIAAGLCTLEYPSGYATLVGSVLGHRLHKHDTRTDWSRRPLSASQLAYALDDVVHLDALLAKIEGRLGELGRLGWLATEMETWQSEVERYDTPERWRRLPGLHSLDGDGLGVARELWLWREAEAKRRDVPVRRVLRDDLILEMAKLRSTDPQRLLMVRGMERGDLKNAVARLVDCVRRGLESPEKRVRSTRFAGRRQFDLAASLLSSALASICRTKEIADSLVGTMEDVRDLVAFRLGLTPESEPPALATGWRAEVVGHELEDLLAGRSSMRIVDPYSDHPLKIEAAAGRVEEHP